MATHEIALSLEWLYATLSGDNTLMGYAPGGVWRVEAPPGTATPFVVIAHQSGSSTDTVAFGGVRLFSEMLFRVEAIGVAKNWTALTNAASRIDALLTVTQQTAVTGGTILSSFRVQPTEDDPLIEGGVQTNIGGIYKIRAKGA